MWPILRQTYYFAISLEEQKKTTKDFSQDSCGPPGSESKTGFPGYEVGLPVTKPLRPVAIIFVILFNS